jgi:BMFP domain-containing protein YqiC
MFKSNPFNSQLIENLAKKLAQNIPESAVIFQKEFESIFKKSITQLIMQLNLVSREEFDVQSKVLIRTREKIDSLEKRFIELQKKDNDNENSN